MIQIAGGFFTITLRVLLSLDWKQIDDGVAIDAHGRKAHLAGSEFVETFRFQAHHPGVEFQRALDIADIQDDMVEFANFKSAHDLPPLCDL
jgi:hypothetical protein